jgi:hypothetical protein
MHAKQIRCASGTASNLFWKQLRNTISAEIKKKSARSSENTGIENANHNTFPKNIQLFWEMY